MAEPVTVLCPECQTLIEVRDVQQLVLSLHQANECPEVSGLVSHSHE